MKKILLVYMIMTGLIMNLHSQTTDTNKPARRAHHSLIYDPVKKVVMLTGGSTPLEGGKSYTFFNDIWTWDGRIWKNEGTAGAERSGLGLATDERNIYSFGGFTGRNSVGELRKLENMEWKQLSNEEDMAVAEPGFVYDSDRKRFIAFGGSKSRGLLHDKTYEWDGTKWKVLPVDNPPARQAATMVYDTKRKKVILFGGMANDPGSTFKDLWEFDGNKWILADTGTGPAKRMAAGYTYDTKRGLFIVFGGMNRGGSLGDTWAWDGKKWKLLASTGPAARSMGYMAYDANRDRVVLFGGRLNWPNDADDTWEWDGVEWKQVF